MVWPSPEGEHKHMRRAAVTLAFIAGMVLASGTSLAHDSWISRGALKNAAGEWCCGEGDCFVIDSERVVHRNGQYLIYAVRDFDDDPVRVVETIPESDVQPSPDGAYWRCRRPDGSRRCFFAPPPGS